MRIIGKDPKFPNCFRGSTYKRKIGDEWRDWRKQNLTFSVRKIAELWQEVVSVEHVWENDMWKSPQTELSGDPLLEEYVIPPKIDYESDEDERVLLTIESCAQLRPSGDEGDRPAASYRDEVADGRLPQEAQERAQ